MKLGVISRTAYALDDPEVAWDIRSFVLSPQELSFFRIFDSAFATPARYVEEIFLRLCELEDNAPPAPKFVFNPLFSLGRLAILQVIEALRGEADSDSFAVVADQAGVPIGYRFPAGLGCANSRFLSLLSAVDGELDATLLGELFGARPLRMTLPRLRLSLASINGFVVHGENRPVYRLLAERTIATLRSSGKPRDSIPFTAFMPHHAGDVLFFCLAFNRMRSRITRVAVNRAYLDIVRDNAPGLEALALDAPLINRDAAFARGVVTPESAYFMAAEKDLPRDSFYYYCRPSRGYNTTQLHLIDHFGFAIGARMCSAAQSLTRDARQAAPARPRSPVTPPRVLLHFDAGWALKVYPKSSQERLIDILRAKGYALTVLADRPGEYAKCSVTEFRSYAHFKTLLDTHDLLVGMDSFPAHYAAHVRGLPTLCLFSSTRPENSNAPGLAHYAFLEQGLKCRPCQGIARCPLYGADYCDNFVSPERVAEEIDRLLARAGRMNFEPGGDAAPSRSDADARCRPGAADMPRVRKRISLRHLGIKVALIGPVWPHYARARWLTLEFAKTARTEGIVRAAIQAARFLRKTVSGKSSA